MRRAIREDGLAVTSCSDQEFKDLAYGLGRPVANRRGGAVIERVSPLASSAARPRSLSAIHGLGPLPLHTDGAHHRSPPRVLLLRLANDVRSHTRTLLKDTRQAELSLREERLLRREQWLVRGGRARTFYSPVILFGTEGLRFDPGCMEPPGGTTPLGHLLLSQKLANVPTLSVEWLPSMTIAIDNRRFVHGREAVSDVDDGRQLIRTLIQ